MKMFKLMQIYATIDASVDAPSGEGVRCLIMADNTDEALPTDGGKVDGLKPGQFIDTGSIAVTPFLNIAICGNNREWGEWI